MENALPETTPPAAPEVKKTRKTRVSRKARVENVETTKPSKGQKINSLIGHIARGVQEVVAGIDEVGGFKSGS